MKGIHMLRGAFAVLGAPPSTSCPSLSVSLQANISGTLTFVADETYTASIYETATETSIFPGSCLNGVTECSSLEAAFQAAQPAMVSTMCTGTPATSCTCTLTVALNDPLRDGTYTVSGSAVTMHTDDGKTLPKTYCVRGNELTLENTNSSGTQSVIVGIRQ